MKQIDRMRMGWYCINISQLNMPGGGLWNVPCICIKKGLKTWPAGVSSRSLAWFRTLLGIPVPVRNSAASSEKWLQLYSMMLYFSAVNLGPMSFKKSSKTSWGI